MSDAQTTANEIRDRMADNPTLQRLGIEVLRATATDRALTLRARHRDRVLTIERGDRWLQAPLEALANGIAHELIVDALDNSRPAAESPTGLRRPWRVAPGSAA